MKGKLIKFLFLCLFLTNALFLSVKAEISTQILPKVRMIYIVPSDKIYNEKYKKGMENAIKHLQDFYLKQMGNGKTFFVNSSIVEVLRSNYSSSTFSQTMWSTAIDEVINKLNANWNDPNNRWLLFVDSDVACDGQGIGGTNGFAVMSANDLRGLTGEKQIYNCDKDRNVPQFNTPARWVGGLGHELAHSWLVPHPSQCDPVRTSSCPVKALMDLGYTNYPNTFLLDADKNILNASNFITNKPIADSVFNFFERRLPNIFPEHRVSKNKNGRYIREYTNGAILSESNGVLFYKLNSASGLRSLSTPIKNIFESNIGTLNNIPDDFLTKQGSSSSDSYGFKNKWRLSTLTVNGNDHWKLIEKNDGYFNICKNNDINKCLHNEYGSLQLSNIQGGWWSAQWSFENTSDGYVKIRNKWKRSEYIHVEHGSPSVGSIQSGWWSAQWSKFSF